MPVRQEVVDSDERVRRFAATLEAPLQLVFVQAIRVITNSTTLAELADLLEAGRIDDALRSVEAAAGLIGNTYVEGLVASALATTGWANTNALINPHTFNQFDNPVVVAARNARLDIIRDFTSRQRDAVLAALVDGAERGLNPRQTARLFRDAIGLTPSQVEAIARYRRSLTTLDREALRRELRDKRADSRIDRAIREGEPLPPEVVDRLVNRYREGQLRFRAERIARSESLAAANAGSFEAYEQMLRDGALDRDEMFRTWTTAIDGRERPSHNRLNGTTIGPGEVFKGDFRTLRIPHAPEAAAEERVNCRCALQVRLRPIQ